MSSKAKIYLYKEGNECESITGGITDADMLDSTGNHWKVNGTLTKNENSIHIQTGSTTTSVKFARTKNLISLTKFRDLYINVLNTTEYSTDKFTCLLVSKTLDIGNSASGFTRNVNTKGLNKLDISDKTESYYVATRVLNNSSVLEFDYIYLETNENVISINSQNISSINFSCNNLDNLITITKAEVYINNKLSETYEDNFENLTYTIDNSLCGIGKNNITIKVIYTQGDDIYETVEEILTHTVTVNNLPATSSLKDVIDRQELLNNSIEVQKSNLKNILVSKNVELAEDENKISNLIDKVANIELGKKWASGTITTTITNSTSSTTTICSALPFKPSLAFVILKTQHGGYSPCSNVVFTNLVQSIISSASNGQCIINSDNSLSLQRYDRNGISGSISIDWYAFE